MQITECWADWTEDKNFSFPLSAAGNHYVFIQCLSPATLHAPYCDIHLSPGACILFDKHVPLTITFTKKAAHFHWFFLQGDLTKESEHYGITFNRIYYPNTTEVKQIICSIEKALVSDAEYFEEFCACKINELLITLHQSAAKPYTFIREPSNSDGIYKLRNSLIANYKVPQTLAQMCKIAAMSKGKLAKSYKQAYGLSPQADLMRIRLQHAKFMLLTQNLSIKEIAQRCGFASAAAFSKVFKAHTGYLPSVYKHAL